MINVNRLLKEIQIQLTCSICLGYFKQPKLLLCQHTFCLSPCLVKFIEGKIGKIKCPECRVEHRIPQLGVEYFPNNMTMQQFSDLYSNFKKAIHSQKLFKRLVHASRTCL